MPIYLHKFLKKRGENKKKYLINSRENEVKKSEDSFVNKLN